MIDNDELVQRIKDKGLKNVEVARVLGLPDSRIPAILRGERPLKLDEAVKLVRAFGLEQAQPVTPLPAGVCRLLVRHVAEAVGVPLPEGDPRLSKLGEDLRAFSVFAADPRIRSSLEAAEGFLQAMRMRRPMPEEVAAPGTDPRRAD